MAEKKEKRYLSDDTQIMAEWDWEKNNAIGLTPQILYLLFVPVLIKIVAAAPPGFHEPENIELLSF